jgi:inorganic pyrophosphatase
MDAETGALFLDRDLFTSMIYPTDYGSIPKTLSEDGDAVDALVLVTQPHIPMSVIRCRPIGIIKMRDEKGRDDKIICVPTKNIDPRFSDVEDIEHLPAHVLDEVKHFFEHMKELEEGKFIKFEKFLGAKEAKKYIKESIKLYEKTIGENGK